MGGYRLFYAVPAYANQPTIYLDLSHSDPAKREVFNNRDFRAALGHALDREELIDVVCPGQGVPSQAAPRPDSPFHVERLANQHLEYDPDLANEMLDAAGFAERDADGCRLGPDGEPIVFVVQATPGDGRLETIEIVGRARQDIGINAQFREVDRSLMTTALIGNDCDAYIWDSPGGIDDSISDPRGFLPFNTTVISIAPLWAQWNMNPETGEEAPAAVREQLELYLTIDAIPDAKGRIERMKEVLEMAADQFYSIGIRQRPPGFGIAKTCMGNILDPQLIAVPLWRPEPDTVQFFIEAEAQK